jgi:hypothetical protein
LLFPAPCGCARFCRSVSPQPLRRWAASSPAGRCPAMPRTRDPLLCQQPRKRLMSPTSGGAPSWQADAPCGWLTTVELPRG